MFVECRHIKPRGTKCGSPALKGRPYCYYHDQLHTYTQDGIRDDKGPFCLPSIEDACGIQHALMQIMGSMANGRLDSREGVRLIYGLQVALQALDRVPQTPPQEIVEATECDGVGVDVALSEGTHCEPHAACPTCTNRFGCSNVARQNKKSIRALYDEGRDRRERAEREPLALPATGSPAAPPPALAPGNALASNLPAPTSTAIDQQREANLEARINKFRPNQREADRIAREQEISRMLADHEITLEDAYSLPDDAELPTPAERRRTRLQW
jgi:hypothetical protein